MRAQLCLKMSTTPWWERKEAEIQAERGADAACSVSSSTTVRVIPSATPPLPRFSTPEDLGHDPDHPPDPPPRSIRMQYSCRTAPDENGVMRRKCERIVKKFRQCPGAPRECLEETREETDETNATREGCSGRRRRRQAEGGSSRTRSSSRRGRERWAAAGPCFRSAACSARSSETSHRAGRLNKDGSEDAGRMNDRRPGFVERAMEDAVGGMFRGLFREMEREMERTMERRPDDGAAGGPPPATRDDDWSRGSRRA